MEYIAKYAAKCEKNTKNLQNVVNDVIRNADPHDSQCKTIRSMALQSIGQKAYGMSEIQLFNLRIPIVETNVKTIKICLSDRRQVNLLHEVELHGDRLAFKNELLDLYASRVIDVQNYSASCKAKLEFQRINFDEFHLVNFYDFSHWFAYIGKILCDDQKFKLEHI